MQPWSPRSFENCPQSQAIEYPNNEALEKVTSELQKKPPLVTTDEIIQLKNQLKEATLGNRFLLQGGDCAESFDDCQTTPITNKFKILLQMSLILVHGLRKPIIRVGRIAGQYVKPRSNPLETKGEITLPSYRGDMVNKPEFGESERTPNPKRLLQGYAHSAVTLNYLRSLVNSGFATLYHPERWDLSFVHHSKQASEYFSIVNAISDSLDFIRTIDGLRQSSLDTIDFFTSHEALHLPYESSLTRLEKGSWYNLSTHFPWIGMRTASIDGAHIEYLRGISNPIAIKVGPSVDEQWCQNMINTLNPENEPGRLTLITRLGQDKIKEKLPNLIKAAKKTGKYVLWSCDPMHGNTQSTSEGIKTRHFDDIVKEVKLAIDIHRQNNSFLGGIHLELTGENVTECIGGARGLEETDLKTAYHSLVDPRLNYEQSLEIALQITKNIDKIPKIDV